MNTQTKLLTTQIALVIVVSIFAVFIGCYYYYFEQQQKQINYCQAELEWRDRELQEMKYQASRIIELFMEDVSSYYHR